MSKQIYCVRILLHLFWLFSTAMVLKAGEDTIIDCYVPINGGYEIRLTQDTSMQRPASGSLIGVVDTRRSVFGEGHSFGSPTTGDNPRLHRRPLYPPADKSLIWNESEREILAKFGFRPLVLAYNEPRFLFDMHSAGGLAGHLHIGISGINGKAKWLHQWSEITVRYNDGRMIYSLKDADFPGTKIQLEAAALSECIGVILKIQVENAPSGSTVIWAFGGASAFFTNYAMNAPEFSFTPVQCNKNRIELSDSNFILSRNFEKNDVVLNEPFAAARYLKNWTLQISGGSSWNGSLGWGTPEAFVKSPSELLAATEWGSGSKDYRVAVSRISLENSNAGFVVVGAGKNIKHAITNPQQAWQSALNRNEAIASRVIIKTPDPYLNAAATMMAFATDATWGDSTIMHGAWSWRFGYLGWRGWYGSNCYGWMDRIRRCIQNQIKFGLIGQGDDAGGISSLLDTPGGVFYNMNEVFLDQVRQYFDYTNDIDLMRAIFPVLKGILDWEDRRLQPGNEDLYENALNTWISDSHWYIGSQCTQASSYMLGANNFMADLAKHLGSDPTAFEAKAARIRDAMQRKLWMAEQGVFAECLDTRGNKMRHEEPELPTLYHAAEFGAANPLQIGQMLDWAHRRLKWVSTPGGGKLVWSSNWYPNSGRSYTHSTHEMAYGEELNFALTHYMAGRSDDAYGLLRATLCGIFNGPTPGGLSCHSTTDGRQRANDEFSDAISMWGRTLMEGLFGIKPRLPDGFVEVTPQFPSSWTDASIRSPMVYYTWKRNSNSVHVTWNIASDVSVRFRIPLHTHQIISVKVSGKDANYDGSKQHGLSWISIHRNRETTGTLDITFVPDEEAPKTNNQPDPGKSITPWNPPFPNGKKDVSRWSLIELESTFNATISDALAKVEKEAVRPKPPASQVGFDYWRSHLGARHHGDPVQTPSDKAWRKKVGADGVAWTTDGIPFKTTKVGPNIGIVTLAGGYPASLRFAVNASGKSICLMLSGMSFPAQSHVPHLRVSLQYDDGTKEQKTLVAPFDIGDCWSTWCGRWHDTAANGFENLGGRFGPSGSTQVKDLSQPINVDTEAHLMLFDLNPNKTLSAVSIEALANDIIFGVMGASILKN